MTKSSTAHKKHSVFIVDDHPVVRDWLTRMIQQEADLDVCGWSDNVDDAIRSLERLKPDIIIVDISLRGKSGLELIRFLIDQNPDQNILVYSMHDESVYATRALRAGARGHVSKSEPTDKVLLAIRRILAGEFYFSEAITKTLFTGVTRKKCVAMADDVHLLSDRELEVFRLLAAGRETPEIAKELSVSLKTVQTYCARIKEKLNLQNATELLQAATRWFDAQNSG
jgi:DNA-binding NarL/FixJ family response regulator